MSTEQNKAVSRRWFLDMFSQGKLELADQVNTTDYDNHDPYLPPGSLGRGPAASQALITLYRGAFPDVQFTIDDQVAEGDRVVTRWTATGTNNGSLMGMPATGKAVTISGIGVDRFVGGKIAETWPSYDLLGMLQQLGFVPTMGQ